MRLLFPRLTVALGATVTYAVLAATLFSAEPVSVGPLGTPLPAVDKKIPEIADAIGRFNDLNLAGALEKLREAVEKHPDRLPPAQVIMAQLYAQANQAAQTWGSLERAVVEAPEDPEAYVILADIELGAGRVNAATLR
jgi:Tfp pilus assembly protein PilF